MSNIPISLSEQEKMSKKSFHQRNDSGELDVFEAARYFSGGNEVLGGNLTQKSMKELQHTRLQASGGGRMSLDLPSMRNSVPSKVLSHATTMTEKPIKEKKYKQPSSPGGKLASFLNSLFNQTSSKKKKKSKSTTQSIKDEDESPCGRRKRRSSISHFTIGNSNSTSDSKSIYSTSSTTTSGLRTPPPFGYNLATKTCEDLSNYSDHKPVLTSLTKPITGLDEKFKFRDGYLEKHKNLGIWADKCQTDHQEKENFKRFNEEDEGGDSDSSSDLFELSNFDLGYYSSGGLPVYETTRMDSIKRGAPISSGGPM